MMTLLRLRTPGPHLLFLRAMQRRGCTHHSSRSPASNASMPDSARSPKSRSVLPPSPVTDWFPGGDYYFGADEEKRFLKPCVQPQYSQPNGVNRSVGNEKGGTQDANNATGKSSSGSAYPNSSIVHLRGSTQTFAIDTSIPPLRREEVERWALEGSAVMKGWGLRRRSDEVQVKCLLPLDAMVTYLGDDMRKLDQMYRQSGMYTASEVAEVFLQYVPTFPVDVRRVWQLVPNSLQNKIEKDLRTRKNANSLFVHYPMLFHFRPARYATPLVQLNSKHWFVRQHPLYGKADFLLKKYRVHNDIGYQRGDVAILPSGSVAAPLALQHVDGGAAAEGGTASRDSTSAAAVLSSAERAPLAVRVFQALIRNLPRFPTPSTDAATSASATYEQVRECPYVKQRYAPLNVVQWINSFPPDDAKFMRNVPEQSVLQVLGRYVRVFQLMSLTESDANIFVEGKILLAARQERIAAGRSASVTGSRTTGNSDGEDLDEIAKDEGNCGDVTSGASGDGDGAQHKLAEDKTMPVVASAPPPAQPATVFSADTAERAARFQQAITDDLIGVDEILSGPTPDSAVEVSLTEALSPHDEEAAADRGEDSVGEHNDDEPFSWGEEEENDDSGAAEDADGNGDGGERSVDERGGWDEKAPSFRGSRAPLPPGASEDNVIFFGLPLEEIYVRRLPPDVAPRSLSDWDEMTSPDVELVALAARFLAPPPSVRTKKTINFFTQSARQYNPFAPPLTLWRWVPVERLYRNYTVEQRHYLRREYRGLVNFLRYHGKLFELSNDLMYVIAHDPEGKMAPFPIMERRFSSDERVVLPSNFDDNERQSAALVGENERALFLRATCEGRIPTCRRHLLLLDPANPIFLSQVLHEEIAELLPNYPVRLAHVMRRLPPLLRAALPHQVNFRASKVLHCFTDRGVLMLERSKGGVQQDSSTSTETPMSVEDAIAELLQVPIGPDGVTVRALRFMHLSAAAVNVLCDHYGTLFRAIEAYPQYFTMEEQEACGKKNMVVRFRK
jgi:hypothetical protein